MKSLHALFLAAILAAPLAGEARDDRLRFSIADALATPAAQAKLDPEVKLFFGKESKPSGAKAMGEASVSRKTSGVGKSDLEACQWAFLSVALELQAQARRAGGDAVVAIQSNYKHEAFDSPTEFVCGAGSLMAGVAFRGQIAKLKGGSSPAPAAAQ